MPVGSVISFFALNFPHRVNQSMCVKENFEFETSVQKYLYGSLLNGPKNFVFKFDHIYKIKSIFDLIILNN
jgi:hypothetical protein